MTATKATCGLLVRGARLTRVAREARRALPVRVSGRVPFYTDWQEASRHPWRTLYVVSSLEQLANEERWANVRHPCRFLAFVDQTPPEAIPEYLFRLQVRSERRIHLVQRNDVDDIRSLLKRLLQSLSNTSEEEIVADAWWEDNQFVVLSPGFERLRVPLDALPAPLRNAGREVREDFRIDQYGDFVYWPRLDVHMGWDQFLQAVDPMSTLRAEQKNTHFNSRYGRAIRSLRESAGLTQGDIPGLDERTIRRIERGQTRATANAIARLAEAHGMEPSEYMAELSHRLQDPDSPTVRSICRARAACHGT
jgi:hypothetical protein